MLRKLTLIAAFLGCASLQSFATPSYPLNPDPDMTPGSLCTHPTSYRYPEHIPYCKRNVSSGFKRHIIEEYDQQLGYNIQPRQDFKIDHLIPLCMGGSNEAENLWPQHKSVYAITDPIEPLACQKMAEGKLRQARAVELIRQVKLHLDQADQVMEILESL